jgi:hypothetical protein
LLMRVPPLNGEGSEGKTAKKAWANDEAIDK